MSKYNNGKEFQKPKELKWNENSWIKFGFDGLDLQLFTLKSVGYLSSWKDSIWFLVQTDFLKNRQF